MLKTYVIEYDCKASVTVEIDHDILTDELLHEINNFWSEAEYRLRVASGNVLKAVLKMLARDALVEEVSGTNAHYLFTQDPPEGWPKLDGSYGIKFISCEELVIDYDDMTISCDGDDF